MAAPGPRAGTNGVSPLAAAGPIVAAMASESGDHYRVLQVDPAADLEVIQAAYRVLARRYHPDLSGSDET